MRHLADAENEALGVALHQKGELFFTLPAPLLGVVVGSLLRLQRPGKRYRPHLGERLISLMSQSHRCVTEFLHNFGQNSVEVEAAYREVIPICLFVTCHPRMSEPESTHDSSTFGKGMRLRPPQCAPPHRVPLGGLRWGELVRSAS
jgi:hypothetical protein